ncbi:MAG TPA: WD40 repeat domain-containing protein [Anaerolineae bacterium]|nr:WD40 repeat domain-containing protein [Anaerolineae bacterium]
MNSESTWRLSEKYFSWHKHQAMWVMFVFVIGLGLAAGMGAWFPLWPLFGYGVSLLLVGGVVFVWWLWQGWLERETGYQVDETGITKLRGREVKWQIDWSEIRMVMIEQTGKGEPFQIRLRKIRGATSIGHCDDMEGLLIAFSRYIHPNKVKRHTMANNGFGRGAWFWIGTAILWGGFLWAYLAIDSVYWPNSFLPPVWAALGINLKYIIILMFVMPIVLRRGMAVLVIGLVVYLIGWGQFNHPCSLWAQVSRDEGCVGAWKGSEWDDEQILYWPETDQVLMSWGSDLYYGPKSRLSWWSLRGIYNPDLWEAEIGIDFAEEAEKVVIWSRFGWQLLSWQELTVLREPVVIGKGSLRAGEAIRDLVLSPQGEYIAIYTMDDKVEIWLANGSEATVAQLPLFISLKKLTFLDEDTLLWLDSDEVIQAWSWQINEQRIWWGEGEEASFWDLAWDEGREWLAVGGERVVVIENEGGERGEIVFDQEIVNMAVDVSQAGALVATLEWDMENQIDWVTNWWLRLWDVTTGEMVGERYLLESSGWQRGANQVVFVADGAYVMVKFNGEVRLYEVASIVR